MDFNDRLALATEFENDVMKYLTSKKMICTKNGTEHTHPDFVKNIRPLTDAGSLFVRFAPDGIALRNYTENHQRTIHWEAKSAKSIEMDAYNTYIKYAAMGCTVIVFVKNRDTGKVYCCNITDLKFRDVPEHFVTNDAGWIDPKKANIKIKNGSMTPYKYIDFDSLHELTDFNTN